jgi:predicted TIM-barrel fold metal-dependent hydrolase
MLNGMTVVDVHGHVAMPAGNAGHLSAMMGTNSPLPNPMKAQLESGMYGGRLVYANDSTGAKVGRRAELEQFEAEVAHHIDHITERNIDVQVIGPRPYLTAGWIEPHLIPAWTQYVNSLIAMQCGLHPDRFYGACLLPMLSTAPDASHVIGELDRCVNEFGFVAAYAVPDPSGRKLTPGMHDSYWYPLYERAQQLQVPLIVHGSTSFDPRFRGIPHNYQMSFAIEQYIASQCFRWSDVFDRYPGLKVVICHCGSVLDRFLPYDEVHVPQKDLRGNLFYDSCSYNQIMLEAAIRQRGVDQVCFGSEAPGSGSCLRRDGLGKTADDLVPVIDSFGFLTDEDKVKIFRDNPLKILPRITLTAEAAR